MTTPILDNTDARSLSDPTADNRSRGHISSSGQRYFIAYNTYRALASTAILALLISPETRPWVGHLAFDHFIIGTLAILVSALGLLTPLGRQMGASDTRVFGLLLLDVVAVNLIANASGGLTSGLSVLNIFTIAAGAILLSTPILSVLIAALATIGVLSDTLWWVTRGVHEISLMLPAGILGALFFTVAITVQILTRRMVSAEAQVASAEHQIVTLQQLNQQIILHMKTGVLLIQQDETVQPINAAARDLLAIDNSPRRLSDVSKDLSEQYRDWRGGCRARPIPFRQDLYSPPLIANFSWLDTENDDALAFVDDYAPMNSYVQSVKINSMSKLTASIAHEIRNPLSAICHAAQLLQESPDISEHDKDLCEIMLGNSERVNQLIANVLEVSRRKAPNLEYFNCATFLRAFHSQYQSETGCGQNCVLAEPLLEEHIRFDRDHLRRILSNLYDNALRHSLQDTGRAYCQIATSLIDNKAIALDVIDTGNGVPGDLEARLFEPFFTTSEHGTGLGLYLCRELCDINGADLLYLRDGEGRSVFRVRVAIADADE
jgi:two-component system sensor histidine kinase PilS (NtrC family)